MKAEAERAVVKAVKQAEVVVEAVEMEKAAVRAVEAAEAVQVMLAAVELEKAVVRAVVTSVEAVKVVVQVVAPVEAGLCLLLVGAGV